MLRCRSDCGRVRRPMRLAVLLAVSSLLLFATGCKTDCRQLSEKLCDCTSSTTEKTQCLTAASTKEANTALLTVADEARCKGLLDVCDCRLIDPPAGKERCGFAVGADGGF